MAIKDWNVIHDSKLMLRYICQSNGNILEIYPEKIRGSSIWFIGVTDNYSIKEKDFKTKGSAIAFAKRYMKNNPKEYPSDAFPSQTDGMRL